MKAICANCRHYRETDVRDNDGSMLRLGYCKATRNYAYRKPDQTCKKYHYDERKALEG